MQKERNDFEAQKKEVELSLARTILTQIKKQTISFAHGQQIARHILDTIDGITNSQQLLLFLENLASEWPIFENLRLLYRSKVVDVRQHDAQLHKVQDDLTKLSSP